MNNAATALCVEDEEMPQAGVATPVAAKATAKPKAKPKVEPLVSPRASGKRVLEKQRAKVVLLALHR